MEPAVTFLVDATDRAYAWFAVLASRGVDLTSNAHVKCKHEAAEFADNPCLEEAADVFISLCGALAQFGWTSDDLAVAVDSKMAINENRKWAQQPDGTYQHTTEGEAMSLDDELQDLVAQPIIATQVTYRTAVRDMNIHDFHYPEEGGQRLIDVMDSAKQELAVFARERDERLQEPMQVRIIVEVTSCTEPDPDAG